MHMTNPIIERCQQLVKQPIKTAVALSGGCICQSYKITLEDDNELFVKTHSNPPQSLFYSESESLVTLAETKTLRVPEVIAVNDKFLLLEYIHDATPGPLYWTELAQGLAEIHRQRKSEFGFKMDNYCGETPQANSTEQDGFDFFAENRLIYQMRLAREAGLLNSEDCKKINAIASNLKDYIPKQPPVLLHGDLWSGNIYCDEKGLPVLIDPACYWGWREADIAMTTLFGKLPTAFYETYNECFPMKPGWEDRLDLYNLYHLLNHLNMFGATYLDSVRRVIKVYS